MFVWAVIIYLPYDQRARTNDGMQTEMVIVLTVTALLALQIVLLGAVGVYFMDSFNAYRKCSLVERGDADSFYLFPSISLDEVRLRDVAQCARLGYLRECHNVEMPPGHMLVWARDDPIAAFAVMRSDGDAIVVFRGTWAFHEGLRNLRYSLREGASVGCEGKLHSGYAGAYGSARKDLSLVLGKARRVLFTGHSMGAALATIAAHDWARAHPDKKATLIGIAGSRCGDAAFASSQPHNLAATIVFNTADPFTNWPPSPSYRHLRRAQRISFNAEVGSWKQCHDPRTYVDELVAMDVAAEKNINSTVRNNERSFVSR